MLNTDVATFTFAGPLFAFHFLLVAGSATGMKDLFRLLQFLIAEFFVVTVGATQLFAVVHGRDGRFGVRLMFGVMVAQAAAYSQLEMGFVVESGRFLAVDDYFAARCLYFLR